MRLSDVKTFKDLCASFFVLEFEPETRKTTKKKTKATRKRKTKTKSR